MNEENINIREIFLSLKERYKLILAITLSFTIISMLLSFFVIKPKYEASVKLFIGKQESKKTDYDNNDVQMYQKLLTTYAEVLKTDDIIESSMKKIHMDENIKGVEKNLKVTPRADTQILEVSYTDTNKLEAANFLNSLTSNFMKESKKLIPNGNIQIIQKVKTPEKAVSPNKTLNILIAFILGLIVGVGVALLLEFLDNTFKSKDELEKALDLPVLATIPDVEGIDEVDRRERRGRR
ncbi:capsular biosynthesis protein [Clostridium baratii]|uniref:Chain length determinant family protein n=1 Tax=Clostridium baratii str. Sullivan TaxID=1415775 RepID=A0A0A7FVI3_9CLOT|nr:Wzz/FepE/Etk N-terminal domain-containing protein [Clostridium baratii]AIY83637.1 chain length determinant family protein [Clostridium baratii str. Sullivan]OPF50662.1 capsular biosynthesis protein [Clostridium baratii]OPF54094.1 capsular biosynthesis protein [Clostridium baratii]OPF58658.1 capsular biosynthesis protein [Clostridium baratii]OPF58970.1 capsular biosynthesis protein [Clostridium baratii]